MSDCVYCDNCKAVVFIRITNPYDGQSLIINTRDIRMISRQPAGPGSLIRKMDNSLMEAAEAPLTLWQRLGYDRTAHS